jgi:archaellum component FlaF (FlaF/FlaG flagellin family)
MAVNPSPLGPKPQFELSDGTPAVGYKLFFYVAGSTSTKQNTYTDSTGLVANANPVILNTLGQPTTQLWFTAGQTYKVVLAPDTDTDPPTSPVWTIDNLAGINDVAVAQAAEWVAGPTPTYVSATSFTLVGDQTSTFTKGRRVKTTNSGGTVYSTITATAFGAVTTVTVANDSGSLDAGLSAVSYGLLSAVNPIIDADMVHRKGTAVASAATTDIWGIAGDFVHVTGVVTITSLGTAPYAGAERTIIFDGALVLTQNATSLILPGATNIFTAAGDRATVRADTTANMIVTSYVRSSGLPAVGTSLPRSYLAGLTSEHRWRLGNDDHFRRPGGRRHECRNDESR